MPKKKGAGKRKIVETAEEKAMRLEMEALKVLGLKDPELAQCNQPMFVPMSNKCDRFQGDGSRSIEGRAVEEAKYRADMMRHKLETRVQEEAEFSRYHQTLMCSLSLGTSCSKVPPTLRARSSARNNRAVGHQIEHSQNPTSVEEDDENGKGAFPCPFSSVCAHAQHTVAL
eukprot:2936903-Rhodomonas_salina.2